MAALNLVLLSPIDDLTARGIEKLMNVDLKGVCQSMGNKLYEWFGGNVQQENKSESFSRNFIVEEKSDLEACQK